VTRYSLIIFALQKKIPLQLSFNYISHNGRGMSLKQSQIHEEINLNTKSTQKQDTRTAINRLLNEPNHPLIVNTKKYDQLEYNTLVKFNAGIINIWGYDWLLFKYNTGAQLYRRENNKKVIRAVTDSKPAESFFGLENLNPHHKLIVAKSPREAMLLDQLMGDEYSVLGLASGEVGTLSSAQKKCLELVLPSIQKIYVFMDTNDINSLKISSMLTEDISKLTNKATRQIDITRSSEGKFKDVTDAIRNGEGKAFIQKSMNNSKLFEPAATASTAIAPKVSTSIFNETNFPSRLPEFIVEDMSPSIGNLLKLINEDYKRDVFLLSSLPVIASHLVNVKIHTRDGLVTPDLYSMVVAPPASGKGVANKARDIGKSLEEHFSSQYQESLRLWRSLRKEDPTLDKPEPRMLFLPANSSNRAMHDSLKVNNEHGIIFESEIDTLVEAFNQDWGNFSALARQAFHHESVSINRKDEYFSLENPSLSIFLSGTEDQFTRLFKNPDNGFFSRFLFYTYRAERKWQSQRATNQSRELESKIDELSKSLKELFLYLDQREKPIIILIGKRQWDRIDSFFNDMTQFLVREGFSDHHHSILRRNSLILVRILTILSCLRLLHTLGIGAFDTDKINTTEDELDVSIKIIEVLFEHSSHFLEKLFSRRKTSKLNQKESSLLKLLPFEFETNDAINIGSQLEYSERSTYYALKKLTKEGILENPKKGLYKKSA
jgi:hypothetical protein|tara:strand:+ start:8649 stop:10802 length:2154 start_codon:yes stop_codon:yes gene_type:complete